MTLFSRETKSVIPKYTSTSSFNELFFYKLQHIRFYETNTLKFTTMFLFVKYGRLNVENPRLLFDVCYRSQQEGSITL